jgi:hypothetical protein
VLQYKIEENTLGPLESDALIKTFINKSLLTIRLLFLVKRGLYVSHSNVNPMGCMAIKKEGWVMKEGEEW